MPTYLEGMMYRLLLILLVILTAQVAQAQDATDTGETEAAVDARSYSTYVARGFGFAVDMPDSGVITSPDDEGWDNDEQVAFEWIGGPDDAVVMIQTRVDSFGEELDAESFELFCTALMQNWSGDEDKFTITTANKSLPFEGRAWNLIEVEDSSNLNELEEDGGSMVYYSVFSGYAGENIYTISFYYLAPVDTPVEALASPILKSFKLTR